MPRDPHDLIGLKFNKLLVIKRVENMEKQKKNPIWVCQCDCGNITEVFGFCLKNGNTKSCGCLVSDSAKKRHVNLIGKRFGMLVVIEKLDIRKRRNIVWKCQCDCGIVIEVITKDLNEYKKSCGCYQKELKADRTETQRLRGSIEYLHWRKLVFKRDNYTCQCCGDSTGGNLNAHHIENFATNPDIRLDVNNGITLCNNCHNPIVKGSFHNTYGTYNNTRKQLEEYISNYHLLNNYEVVFYCEKEVTNNAI